MIPKGLVHHPEPIRLTIHLCLFHLFHLLHFPTHPTHIEHLCDKCKHDDAGMNSLLLFLALLLFGLIHLLYYHNILRGRSLSKHFEQICEKCEHYMSMLGLIDAELIDRDLNSLGAGGKSIN